MPQKHIFRNYQRVVLAVLWFSRTTNRVFISYTKLPFRNLIQMLKGKAENSNQLLTLCLWFIFFPLKRQKQLFIQNVQATLFHTLSMNGDQYFQFWVNQILVCFSHRAIMWFQETAFIVLFGLYWGWMAFNHPPLSSLGSYEFHLI